jgi:D-xylose 1-dehydrogenase (NADP+, D-xylono-1,5-lactone-forming)
VAARTLRVGLVSTANINRKVLDGARVSGVAEVVAVASRDADRARPYADEHGIPAAYGSYEELLAAPDVDAVYISLPNALHVEWSIRALEAGKHVLCEKPLSRHPDQVERAFDVAEARGRVLQEGFMWRYHPQAQRLLELLSRIGTLRMVRASFSFSERRPGDVRLDAGLEGGALMDVGCYCVSAIRLIAGEPESSVCRLVREAGGVDVLAVAGMTLLGDVLAHFDCGMVTAARDELEVVGSDGSLFLDDPWRGIEPVIEVRAGDGTVERVEVPRANPFACELEELAAVAAGERPARFGRGDAVAQARALADLYDAAER